MFRIGDRKTLEALYRAHVRGIEQTVRHGFRIASTGMQVVGTANNRADTAELIQEVFARAFAPAARHAYDGLGPYAAYLNAIARNLLASRARRQGREVPTCARALEQAGDRAAADALPLTDKDVIKVVREFVAGLPGQLKALYEARHVRGLSQRKAAAALGLSRQNVRTLELHLLAGLRQALESR